MPEVHNYWRVATRRSARCCIYSWS